MDSRLVQANCIIFDVGNVLLSFDPEQVAKLLPEAHREAICHAMFDPDWRWSAFDLGVETNEEIAQSIADAAGVPGGREMVLHAFYHFHEIMRRLPLYHLIPELKAQGKTLYALTNYGEPAFTFARDAHPNLQMLDGEVVSSREKLVKPDPALFRLIAGRFGLNPPDTLFIDDSLQNAEAARALGFRVWHYAGDDRLPDPGGDK